MLTFQTSCFRGCASALSLVTMDDRWSERRASGVHFGDTAAPDQLPSSPSAADECIGPAASHLTLFRS